MCCFLSHTPPINKHLKSDSSEENPKRKGKSNILEVNNVIPLKEVRMRTTNLSNFGKQNPVLDTVRLKIRTV